jgi:hypothetical protein
VLTEGRNFGGSLADLSAVRTAFPEANLLRKDFILDEYMLAESRAHGADLVLLMVSVLGEWTREMTALAFAHRLEPLVEARDAAEIAIAARSGARLIGIWIPWPWTCRPGRACSPFFRPGCFRSWKAVYRRRTRFGASTVPARASS